MAVRESHASIDSVLAQFLAEQRERLSERTFRRYEEVVQLLRHSLDGYAYTALDADECRRWQAEFEAHEEGAFCRLFGPEKIPGHLGLGEFLDYFMVRKVIAGQKLLGHPVPSPASSCAGLPRRAHRRGDRRGRERFRA